MLKLLFGLCSIWVVINLVQCRSIPIRSDFIVTKYGPDLKDELDNVAEDVTVAETNTTDIDESQPGFMRRQLQRISNYARKVGGGFSGSAGRVANFIETMCEIMKSIVPVAAAICQVGQFKFCAAADGTALGPGFDSAPN